MTKSESSVSEKRTKKKLTSISIGSKTNGMGREEILRALKAQKPSEFYVWDGNSEDDKPLTQKEMANGLAAYKKRGRPFSASKKKQIAIRLDPEVLEAFQKEGPGWQTRINDALKDWLQISNAAKIDNPDLPTEFVNDLLIAKAEDKSLATPFVPLDKR